MVDQCSQCLGLCPVTLRSVKHAFPLSLLYALECIIRSLSPLVHFPFSMPFSALAVLYALKCIICSLCPLVHYLFSIPLSACRMGSLQGLVSYAPVGSPASRSWCRTSWQSTFCPATPRESASSSFLLLNPSCFPMEACQHPVCACSPAIPSQNLTSHL